MSEKRKTQLPPLTALKAFDAVGRTGSMRAAGDELCISHTVVSRHIKLLQDTLGIQLMRTQGRSLVLTEKGISYHSEVAKAFEVLRHAQHALTERERDRFEVWCVPGIVHRWLLPRLPELATGSMGMSVNIHPTLTVPDLLAGEADAVMVYSLPSAAAVHPDLLEEVLLRPRVFPVASPAFLARYPACTSGKGLSGCPLLHEESTEQWSAWLEAASLRTGAPLQGQKLWHAHLAIEAARLGQGVALANDLLVAEELRNGTLVEPFPSCIQLGEYRLRTVRRRANDPALRMLRRWLLNALAVSGAS